jgi:D-lactate dehydrogenase
MLQVGYSLNALVDFPPSDPISIIKHLMVGSEGTLGFVSNVTYKCVPQAPHAVGMSRRNAHIELSCRLRVLAV